VLVIVVDVSAAGGLREAVAEARGGCRWPLEYVAERTSHEARRRAVALALGWGADRVAFLEGTAEPSPHWLDELLAAQARHEADVVEGPVVPRYADEVPAWVRRGGFFEAARGVTGGAVPPAGPCDVTVTRAVVLPSRPASDAGRKESAVCTPVCAQQ